MGCGSSSGSHWFEPLGPESRGILEQKEGFGGRGNASYRTFARGLYKKHSEGDVRGLDRADGSVLVARVRRVMDWDKIRENYCILDSSSMPRFVRARAFCEGGVPLGAIPVGIGRTEDVIERGKKERRKWVLGAFPRSVALFVYVDGVAVVEETVCQDSLRQAECEVKAELKDWVHASKVDGSLMSFTPTLAGTQHPFVSIPMLYPRADATDDVNQTEDTGWHAATTWSAFANLIRGLGPGPHEVKMSVRFVYDHGHFWAFEAGRGGGAGSSKRRLLRNAELGSPHPDPRTRHLSPVVASGAFKIVIKAGWSTLVAGLALPFDEYAEDDKELLRASAKSAIERLGYGSPAAVLLTSSAKEAIVKYVTGSSSDKSQDYQRVSVLGLFPRGDDPETKGFVVRGSVCRGFVGGGRRMSGWTYMNNAEGLADTARFAGTKEPVANKAIFARMEIMRRPAGDDGVPAPPLSTAKK